MNIYVGNLALETTEDELRQEFIAFGQVLSVSIMNDRYIGSGQSRGYGFVEMLLESQAKAAIAALSGKMLRLRSIDVIQALPLSSERDNTRYGKGSGRFSGRVRQRRI
jgi:RNA recognition motif-containing protein